MKYEFEVTRRVTIVTLNDAPGIVVDRFTEKPTQTNFYRVAFERFGSWSIDVYPEMSLSGAKKPGWFKRKFFGAKDEKPSEITRPMPSALGADVQLPPGFKQPQETR